MGILPLSELNLVCAEGPGKCMNVCIVSSEFLGPVKNSGIGTVTSALAKHLVSEGHSVTLLYTYVGFGKPVCGDKPWPYWVAALAAEGIVLEHIPHEGGYRAWREASWLVRDFLSQRDFDLVYFNDYSGSSYYSLLAKHTGLSPFCDQLHCVITHGAMEWVFEHNDYYARLLSDVEWIGLERRSVEMADVVIAPSKYLLREYERFGWHLPAHTFYQPYPLIQKLPDTDDNHRLPIGEIVFFGRLEVRKGLWLFCEALDQLADRFPKTDVTFLGRVTEFSGISSALQIVNRSASWPLRVRLFSNFDREEALSYLRKPGKLAVMPSLADNSPCAVYECLEAGIPFVSTRGSGIEELVHKSSWDRVLAEPNVKSLTETLAHALEHGACLGRPRFDPAENLATWSAWHQFVANDHGKLLQGTSHSYGGPTKARGDIRTALIAMIDDGNCAISLLVRNLTTHMKRFGERAAYLLLSSRQYELQVILSEIFGGSSEASASRLCILDSTMIDEARRIIASSSYVFFIGVETEILTPFFITALNKLALDERLVVSCVVATRQDCADIGKIEELPTGDIPGLAALGRPIGGSVWAIAGTKFTEDLYSLDLYDPQLDAITSSSELGQILMQKCRTHGVPIDLLPMVGAVETQENDVERLRTIKEARQSASALGIAPSVYEGGAPWFAISTSVTDVQIPEIPSFEFMKSLSPEYQQTMPQQSYGEDLAKRLPDLAATLGRPELALQLVMPAGAEAGHHRHLVDLATRHARRRPHWDLVDVLDGEKVYEFGLTSEPQAPETDTNVIRTRLSSDQKLQTASSIAAAPNSSEILERPHSARHPGETIRVFADARRLRIKRQRIQAITNLRNGGPGRIFIIDVPLCGQTALLAKLCSSRTSDPLFCRMRLIDQRVGVEIGHASARLEAATPAELSVALHNVYGRVAIAFEFSGAEKMEVVFESLRID